MFRRTVARTAETSADTKADVQTHPHSQRFSSLKTNHVTLLFALGDCHVECKEEPV